VIDVKTPDSPGWWIARLSRALYDPKRQRRLDLLDDWYRGNPPLPDGAHAWKPAFKAFQCQSRTNFAELVVEAARERMTPKGIRTSSDGDATGDAEAWRIWRRANMGLVEPEAHRLMLRFGEGFLLVSKPDAETGVPVVTAEDPRYVVAEQDPLRPWRIVAGLKVYRDPAAGLDLAYLYRPGRVDVATRQISRQNADNRPTRFSETWAWDEKLSGDLPAGLMPLVRLPNHEGEAEFEKHIDLLARINAEILRVMVITQLQAFKQRGMKGLPAKNDKGEKIDWTGMFEADPGTLWAIPPDVEVWESGETNISPLLSAIRDYIRQLAAVTRTTVHTLDPGGENQSAEGAALSREGLVFKVKDRIALATPAWSQVMRACFLWMADLADDAGDAEAKAEAEARADLNGIDVIWEKPDRESLTERASAAAQASAAGVPWETTMTEVMGFSPEQVLRMQSQRDDDLLFAARLAMTKAAANPVQRQPARTPVAADASA
jgi:hypothetical protein